MPNPAGYDHVDLTSAEVRDLAGWTVLEFGADWCGICQSARRVVEEALAGYPGLRHLKIADGKGFALGRTFGIKLWPTLILVREGVEIGRVVRPSSTAAVEDLLATVGTR